MLLRPRLHFVVLAAALAASSANAQTAPGAGQAPPLVTATTRLVQVSVVAKENSEPAAGLTADDFRVFVDGQPQKISFFSAVSLGLAPATAAPLPPDTFTNIMTRGQAMSGITVVLLDLVNTRLADRMFARQQLIKYLEEIQPQDRIGVYVFSGRLSVLHDYTEDMANFQRKLADAKSRLVDVNSTEPTGALDREQSEFDAAFMGRGGNQQQREFYMRNRVMGTLAVFKFIANHLERVPGRKNLIWVSGAFPMIFGYQNFEQMSENYTTEVDATVRALSDANVSVYPVDARGLTPPRTFDASRGSGNSFPSSSGGGRGLSNRSSGTPRVSGGTGRGQIAAHETMDEIAQRTGGHAYYNTNDLAKAIHDAVADSALTYTIGFYPVDEKGDRDFHKIKIETTRRHVNLHYRSGYLDVPPAPPDEGQRMLQLRDALFSPVDATELGLTVHVSRTPAPDAAADLLVTVQPDGVLLKQNGDRRDGQLDMLIAQLDARGNQIDGAPGTHDTINLNLLPDTYQKFTTEGLGVHKSLPRSPRADKVRIVVRDAGSGMIGSLTAPVQ